MWEVEKPMHSYCIIKCSVCLFGTQSYLPTHLAYKLDVAKLSTASLRCSSKFNNCKYKATVLSNSALVFIGASVRFYWSLHWLQICHWILESGALNKFLEISEKRMWQTMWSLNCLPGVMCMKWIRIYDTLPALSSRSHNSSESQAIMGHSCCQGRKCTWGMQQLTIG